MENISVSVRVRPLNRQEGQEFFAWKVDGKVIVQLDPNTRDVDRTRDTKYSLDNVFGPEWTTRQIYEATTQSLIRKVVSGFNSTVFAYGQTSSGKTHTMRGCSDSPGIISLAVSEAFGLILGDETREFLIRVSYMELYNEEVNDLLAPENTKLPIHESKENGPYVCGLREDIVTSPEQVLELLESGEANRHIGSTKMNEKSSRSHTIFRMVVESRDVNAESDDAGAILVSVLTLVDLAGSERVAKTGAEGIRMKEGTAINKSLLTLGNVINKLSEGALVTGGHIPYRDSKLTRILQPSLGGNAKTAIICAMTPALCHVEESHSTLRFACRAKRVINNAVVNEVLSDTAVLKRQAKEIEELKRRLAENGTSAHVTEQINVLRAQLLRSEQEKELMRVKLQEEQIQREKAQKEAEMAKKMMFETRGEPGEAGSKRQNRRETWCPGKSAWSAPVAHSEMTPGPANTPGQATTPANSGGAEPSQRKRSFGRLESAGPKAELSTLMEEDEEEDDAEDGPAPQRRRRDCSAVRLDDLVEEDESEDGPERDPLEQLLASLPVQGRLVLNRFVQQHQETEHRVTVLQQELATFQEAAAAHEANARCSANELVNAMQKQGALSQSLEQAKSQTVQLDKLNKELEAQLQSMEQARKDLSSRHHELFEAHASTKDMVKGLKAELSEARAKLELRDLEAGLRESKEAAQASQLDEATAKLKEKVEELDAIRRSLKAAEERAFEAETRGRELYESVKRLENHVSELESRKRAPLYQKKQEEELKAAVEKAQECEIRAIGAELRAKEMDEEVVVARKQVAELQEEMAAAARQAIRSQEELQERHVLEVQRLHLESAMLKERHAETHAEAEAQAKELQDEVDAARKRVQQLQEDMTQAAQQATSSQEELQERHAQEVQRLQQESAAHQERHAQAHAEASARTKELQGELEAFRKRVQELQEEMVQAALQATRTQEELEERHGQQVERLQQESAAQRTSITQLEEELQVTTSRMEVLVKGSLDQAQEAASTQAQLQRQVDELSAKVQEAAGALKAKEELKEERQRSKQEVMALKAEVQKLQLESKSGAKGKDMAQKELEALKKRLADTEGKLKTVSQEKAAAVQDKANLDRQLKQFQSQKALAEKSLEKNNAVENKKRESIMVNLNKSKEQLNSFEERNKALTVELQKAQMDLTAKQGELRAMDEQLREQLAENKRLREESNRLASECLDLRHQLECAQGEQGALSGRLDALQAEYNKLQADEQELVMHRSKLEDELQERACELEAIKLQSAEQLQAAGAVVERLTAELQVAQAEAEAKLATADLNAKELSANLDEARAETQRVLEAMNAATLEGQHLSDAASLANAEVQRLSDALAMTAAEAQRHLEAANLLNVEVQRLSEVLSAATAEVQRLTEVATLAGAEVQQLSETRMEAQAETQRLSEALNLANAEVQQLSFKLAGLEQACSAQDSLLGTTQSEVQRLTAMVTELQAVQNELQSKLSSHERSAAEDAQLAACRLAESKQEEQRLKEQAAVTDQMVEQLRSQLQAQADKAAADFQTAEIEVQSLDSRVVSLDTEVQRLQRQLESQQQATDEASKLAASQLAEAGEQVQRLANRAACLEKENTRLSSQLAMQHQAAAEAAKVAATRLAAAEDEAQSDAAKEIVQLKRQLLTQLQEAGEAAQKVTQQLNEAAVRASEQQDRISFLEHKALEAARAAETERSKLEAEVCRDLEAAQLESDAYRVQVEELRAKLVALEQQLNQQTTAQLTASMERPLATVSEEDTAGLLLSPAPRQDGIPPMSVTVPDHARLSQLEQLVSSYAAEVETKGATLAAEMHRAAALEQELVVVRRQLDEARSLAHSSARHDVTMSWSTKDMGPSDILDFQGEVERLQRELEDTEFARQEDRSAADMLQKELSAKLHTAQVTAAQQHAQITELQRQCASLQHEVEHLRRAAEMNEAVEPDQVRNQDDAGAALARIAALEECVKELEISMLTERTAKEDLERLLAEVSVQVVAAPPQSAHTQQAVPQDADMAVTKQAVADTLDHSPAVEVALQQHAEAIEQYASLQALHKQLEQEHNSLQQAHAQTCQEHNALRTSYESLLAGQGRPAAGSVDTATGSPKGGLWHENKQLRLQLEGANQKVDELRMELSDLQAACNVAVAAKHTMEQSMNHRILELEMTNIRLQDRLAKHGEPQGGEGPVPSNTEARALLAERDQLKGHVQELVARVSGAEEEVRRLQEALQAAEAALAAQKADADKLVSVMEAELTSLRLTESEWEVQCEDLRLSEAGKTREIELLSAKLAQTIEGHQLSRREGDELRDELRHLQLRLKDLAEQASASQNEGQKLHGRIAHLEADLSSAREASGQKDQLEERLAESESARDSLQAQVFDLTARLATLRSGVLSTAELEGDIRRLRDERDRLFAEKESLQQHLAEERRLFDERTSAHEEELHRVRDQMEEALLKSEGERAQLNAVNHSLESQIHWLTEENQRLQEGAGTQLPPPPPPPPAASNQQAAELEQKIAELEHETRHRKRSELKLMALLYRLRKDVTSINGGEEVYDKLKDIRSLQYDVDYLTQKCQRIENEKAELKRLLDAHRKQMPGAQRALSVNTGTSSVLADKENMPHH